MDKWFGTDAGNLFSICITAVGIYLAILIYTRLAGKRSFSKMSSHDFAITVAIGSMLATTVLSKSISLIEGAVGIAAVYLLQMLLAILRLNKGVNRIMDNPPLLLMEGETVLEENLKKARVTESDLRSKLREANVIELSDVKAVVFESTGDISVLHSTNTEKKLVSWIMKGVNK